MLAVYFNTFFPIPNSLLLKGTFFREGGAHPRLSAGERAPDQPLPRGIPGILCRCGEAAAVLPAILFSEGRHRNRFPSRSGGTQKRGGPVRAASACQKTDIWNKQPPRSRWGSSRGRSPPRMGSNVRKCLHRRRLPRAAGDQAQHFEDPDIFRLSKKSTEYRRR